MENSSVASPRAKTRKKRVPKACESCRHSKVKCDGRKPCSRCRVLKKTCIFEEPPKDDQQLKIESLERRIESLTAQLGAAAAMEGIQQRPLQFKSLPNTMLMATMPSDQQDLGTPRPILPTANTHLESPTAFVHSPLAPSSESSVGHFAQPTSYIKRKHSHLKVEPVSTPDLVVMGLITMEEAASYFNTFFQGCHQYVPVFDTHVDSLQEIRSRSGVLFSTICAAGCRILKGADSHAWHLLNFHTKRLLNAVIAAPTSAPLETIQALLVRACYASERSLLVTIATRLAMDTGLPASYDAMCTRYVSRSGEDRSSVPETDLNLFRRARTWLHTLNMAHILHVDAGDLLTVTVRGDVRRCRVLLENPYTTDLDLHLISQVELNVLRTNTYKALATQTNLSDEDIMEVICNTKIDIDVWFNDWLRIFDRSPLQKRWLVLQLRIQQCWAITMASCRAVRVSGVEDVDAMSETQREILLMAHNALKHHLDIILEEPRDYLHNLHYAMDFVWAKCAFCFLLLLKLCMLLDDDKEDDDKERLVEHGRTLLSELRTVSDYCNGTPSNTGRVYQQLLQTGLEKFSCKVLSENQNRDDPLIPEVNTARQTTATAVQDSNGLESFVPEQFVFEWDFPGLTLFSSRMTEAGWLDDFLKSALIGGDELFGFGWNSADAAE